ncbi:aminotransferase class I/II-fold pyridoxal phosphate-dependent enzyme [Brevibacterium otitidis]|uniref:Aminotransferase class I/II-fold pyridoxal phosphate-dependent enzyme n=1 Tax=Brevibacterium otitidis TaxID=53364 RepID=A0ABV5X436_9MICO|nr:aminotransferase class I/II-fold pyridoxal phosphate-dependent enzyme [Brevibacterium otitidis]
MSDPISSGQPSAAHPDLLAAPTWHQMAQSTGLVNTDGSIRETIFGQMTALAARHDAVNLGQGSPGDPTPDFLVDAATEAMGAGINQYAPGQGHQVLIDAVAEQRRRCYGQAVSAAEVLVTIGATEGLTAAIVALVPRGGEVVVFEPFYDSYAAATVLAGAQLRTVGLVEDGAGGFTPDWEAFERTIGPQTSAIIVNTPHNPTGMVFTEEMLTRIYEAAVRHDAWVLTDEVYEYLVFGEHRHAALASIVDDPARVVSISSAGKSFNITGWKIGWTIAAPEVREAIQAVKQYFCFTGGSPLQPAVAQALNAHEDFAQATARSLEARSKILVPAFEELPGVRVSQPQGGYFTLVDFAGTTDEDAYALNERLTRDYGFTGIPGPAMCAAGTPISEAFAQTIRYSFCKGMDDTAEAAERVRAAAAALR